MRRRVRIAVAVAAVVAALAACADRGASSQAAGPSPQPAGSAPAPSPSTAAPAPSPAPQPTADDPWAFGDPVRLGAFDVGEVPEASGLAASRRTPGVLYLLDDARGSDSVLAVRRDGTTVGRIGIAGLDARDGEGLAVAACGPGDATWCLYVGDIGGNAFERDTVAVWRAAEPDLAGGAPAEPLPATAVALAYPDGPHDAEALLVDDDGSPFVVTKSAEAPPRLYAADGFGDQALADLGPVALPEPALPLASAVVGNVVTGGDVADGRVLLRTYDTVFAYDLGEGSLRELPAAAAVEVPAPLEPQGEAVAWAADGCGYLTVSEGIGDIWWVPCR